MSIKRAKQRTFASDRNSNDDSPFSFSKTPKEPEKTWSEHMDGKSDDVFVPYSLQSRLAKGALVAHTKFGKGIVTNVVGTHVEILFEEGMKKLGHTV